MYADHLPTLGPFPETATPTTTTLFPPPPPPGKCLDDGFYRGNGVYEKIGTGLCVDEGDAAIAFKKRRELTELNYECFCKETCDQEPGCIGYSSNANDDGDGLACRVYGAPGWTFPTLVDRWLDLGSMDKKFASRYAGKKIVKADGEKGMTCYQRKMPEMLLQIPAPLPVVSFAVRETSTADLLVWQREQLTRCREQEASLVSLIRQKGCKATGLAGLRRQGRGSSSDLVMPNECECHCPDCNFWQLPPPICHEPTAPPTPTMPPLPPGVVVVTGAPHAGTPPPLPVQIPLPPLPPIGDAFLPTLGPWPPPDWKGSIKTGR